MTLTCSIVEEGEGRPKFHWYKLPDVRTPMSHETRRQLVITANKLQQSGSYFCRVSGIDVIKPQSPVSKVIISGK